MFTGIVEEIGKVRRVIEGTHAGEISIAAKTVLEGTKIGDSIAVNGVCLTVTRMDGSGFTADVMPETLRRTNLGSLSKDAQVNLERAMAANGRFGGHMVAGHIDGTGRITEIKREENAVWFRIAAEDALLLFTMEKGSIAIDGISLTIAKVEADAFYVSIIPHTGKETTLLQKKIGDRVNLENDQVGKYIYRFMHRQAPEEKQESKVLTAAYLIENGF